MLNHITIMGRLVRDPELRYTQSNIPVTSFTVAVDRDFGKSDSGDKQTDFIDCVAWRSTAEFVNKYFAKGRMAVICGRLQVRDWVDKNENKRRSSEVVVDNIYFGDSRREGDAPFIGSQSSSAPYGSAPSAPAYGAPVYDAPVSYGSAASAQAPAAPQASPFEDMEDDGELPF